jgi:DHA2 family multidrug resistance protein
MRNIGGSIGISVVETILARHEQLHRTELVRNLAPTLPTYQQNLNYFTDLFAQYGSHATAQIQALGQVGRTLDQQAQLWSYVDDFRYMALACMCCAPIVWGLKRVKARAGAAPAH